jgi:hypothetical protein
MKEIKVQSYNIILIENGTRKILYSGLTEEYAINLLFDMATTDFYKNNLYIEKEM